MIGGVGLSLTTARKIFWAVIGGFAGEPEWDKAAGFAAAIFGMGFLCGLIVWAGRGLYRWLGMVGDAIVGLAVMFGFFVSCMLLFEPAMLGPKFSSAGAPMLGFGAVLGLICGAWIGRDWRAEFAQQTEPQPGDPNDDGSEITSSVQTSPTSSVISTFRETTD